MYYWLGNLFREYLNHPKFMDVFSDQRHHKFISFENVSIQIWMKVYWKVFIYVLGFSKPDFTKEELQLWCSFTRIKQRKNPRWAEFQMLKYLFVSQMLLSKNDCDCLIVWSGFSTKQKAMIEVARKKKIPIIFCENGPLPHTMQVDSKGVNYLGSISEVTDETIRKIEIDNAKLDVLKKTPLIVREVSKAKQQKKNLSLSAELPAEFVFIPFQVHNDSQVLLFSSWIPNMEKLLEVVWTAVEGYNLEQEEKLQIVVKEHPSDQGKINYDVLRESWALKGVIFANDHSTQELIDQAEVIVTINSSVGMEALLRNKPVIALGESFYCRQDIVQKAQNPEELLESLYKYKENRDLLFTDQFLYYARYHWLIGGSWRMIDLEHLKEFYQRIKSLQEKV